MKDYVKLTARYLRKNQTKAEALLWNEVRNRKLLGKKFLRQHPIEYKWLNKKRFFVTDFICYEANLVIEIDGGIHDSKKEHDEEREYVLKSMGFKIIRFKNKEITSNVEAVIKKIMKEL